MALKDFKIQLDTLSDSLHHLDPDEHNEALQILHDCIQDLEYKKAPSLNRNSFEENKDNSPETSPTKVSDLSSMEDSAEELNSSYERIENEESDYNLQSEDDSDSQNEVEWKQILRCPNCLEEFEDKNCYLEHLQTYTGKVKPCGNCNMVFNNLIAYKFHRQANMCSKLNKMYKCKFCDAIVCGVSQYKLHISGHKRNQCKTCGEHFSNRKHLAVHSLSVHKVSLNKDSFKCHLCDKSCNQRRSMAYHYKLSHPSCLVCSICLEMFDCDSDLQDHMQNHKSASYTCEKCGQQFTRRQQYLVHVNDHDKYQCLECGSGFAGKQCAVKHAATTTHQVTGIDLLQCAECGELFCSQTLLKDHEAQHKEKMYNCQKCKISFKYERNYLSHLESNGHLEEPKDILACTECKKTFTNKNNLRVHISRMHKTVKEFSCMLCSYKSTVSTNLKRHMELHMKKPHFICDKCGSKFQTKNTLHEHQTLKHSNTKDFSCDKCGNQFSRSSDLNKHLKNVHATTTYSCHCGNKYKSLYNLNRHRFLTHGEVVTKQNRLKKLFPVENDKPPPTPKLKAKKVKKAKKTEPEINNTEELQLLHPSMPSTSSVMVETDVMMTERQHFEFVQVYNIDFTDVVKSEVVYAHNIDNIDTSGLQVVESMIGMDVEPLKQQSSVLVNVRNLFGQPLTNEYVMDTQIDPSLVHGLTLTPQQVQLAESIEPIKEDVTTLTSLQDYITIPSDLNFLNV